MSGLMSARTGTCLLLAVIAGCGGPQRVYYEGRADAEPSLECLPEADVPGETYSEHMRFGLRLSAVAFSIRPPELPDDNSAASITAWSQGPLEMWLYSKTRAIMAARHELDLASYESHRELIISGAIVGMLYEDVAMVLRTVPTPNELWDEPEIRRIFRDTVEGEARPFFATARRAYHACELNGREPDTMRQWSSFCAGRLDLLPAPEGLDGADVLERDFFIE